MQYEAGLTLGTLATQFKPNFDNRKCTQKKQKSKQITQENKWKFKNNANQNASILKKKKYYKIILFTVHLLISIQNIAFINYTQNYLQISKKKIYFGI